MHDSREANIVLLLGKCFFLFQVVMVLVLIAGSDRTSAARLPGMVVGLIFAEEVISTCGRGGPDFV